MKIYQHPQESDNADVVYLSGLRYILETGTRRSDRTGTGVISTFGLQQHYDISHSFPLLTTKRMSLKSVLWELLWFLQGRTDNAWLQERGCNIWTPWAPTEEPGDLGPIYGYQWTNFGAEYISQEQREAGAVAGGVNQLQKLLDGIRQDPFGRRHIVSAWNPILQDQMALPPCHALWQCYVTADPKGKPKWLSLKLTQRSADFPIGVPYNVASYAALTYLLADLLGLEPKAFIHDLGDAHIYLNQLGGVEEQLSRRPLASPQLYLRRPVELGATPSVQDFAAYTPENFLLSGYAAHPVIKFPVAV